MIRMILTISPALLFFFSGCVESEAIFFASSFASFFSFRRSFRDFFSRFMSIISSSSTSSTRPSDTSPWSSSPKSNDSTGARKSSCASWRDSEAPNNSFSRLTSENSSSRGVSSRITTCFGCSLAEATGFTDGFFVARFFLTNGSSFETVLTLLFFVGIFPAFDLATSLESLAERTANPSIVFSSLPICIIIIA